MSSAITTTTPAIDTRSYVVRASAWVIGNGYQEQILTALPDEDGAPRFGHFYHAVLFSSHDEATAVLNQFVGADDANRYDYSVIKIHCDLPCLSSWSDSIAPQP